MRAKLRHLQSVVRLSNRLFVSVQRLARLAGVSCSEIVEVILEEIFEGDLTLRPPSVRPGAVTRPSAINRAGRGTVIPIERARGFRTANAAADPRDSRALRQWSTELRQRARQARERAAAACAAAERARDKAVRVRPPMCAAR
jgi:hypothetical protein